MHSETGARQQPQQFRQISGADLKNKNKVKLTGAERSIYATLSVNNKSVDAHSLLSLWY